MKRAQAGAYHLLRHDESIVVFDEDDQVPMSTTFITREQAAFVFLQERTLHAAKVCVVTKLLADFKETVLPKSTHEMEATAKRVLCRVKYPMFFVCDETKLTVDTRVTLRDKEGVVQYYLFFSYGDSPIQQVATADKRSFKVGSACEDPKKRSSDECECDDALSASPPSSLLFAMLIDVLIHGIEYFGLRIKNVVYVRIDDVVSATTLQSSINNNHNNK